jgi:hypothetical protein
LDAPFGAHLSAQFALLILLLFEGVLGLFTRLVRDYWVFVVFFSARLQACLAALAGRRPILLMGRAFL